LGKAVVQELVRLSRDHKKIILTPCPERKASTRKLGFLRMLTAMAIFQDRAAALQRGHVTEDQ